MAPRNAVALACFFLSGTVALVCEVCWIRMASLVFGSALYAASTVFAVFFGGLALGSWLFGRRAERTPRPIARYAVLELGVGALAALSPLAFGWADAAYGRLYPSLERSFAALSLVRFVLIAALVLPPAVLMGATLPLFCRQFVRREERIARSVGLLYAWNTLGAAAGATACGFVLIPLLGLRATLLAAGATSAALAAAVWLAWGRAKPLEPAVVPAGPGRGERRTPAASRTSWVYALFFGSGLVALANEVLWTRYLALVLHNTVHTYTLTLAIVLLGIALGSALLCAWGDRSRHLALAFGSVQVAAGLSVAAVLFLAPPWLRSLDPTAAGSRAAILVAVLLPSAVLSGIAFPLAVRMVTERAAVAAARVGAMAALNTVGGIVGALAMGFFVLPALGLQAGLLATTGLSVVLGVAAWLASGPAGARWRLAAGAAALAAWAAIPLASPSRLPEAFLDSGGELVDHREGLGANLAVLRTDGVLNLEIDRMWQGQDALNHQIMAAHFPMLLHPAPERVAVVGLGVGQTGGRFLAYDVEALDCVELERELVPLVREHFEADWMDDARVEWIFEDGRNFLTHTDRRYDVISIEVGQTFRPGVDAFYTVEFYARARERLRAGGLLCQFVPLAAFDSDELRGVVRTFLAVFPQSSLWYNTAELLLIGGTDAELAFDPERFRRASARPAVAADLRFAHWGGPAQAVGRPAVFWSCFLLGPAGLAALARGGTVYSDDRPVLGYSVAPFPQGTEEANVRAIGACLEPLDVVLAGPRPPELGDEVEALRERHLADVVASARRRDVAGLLADGRLDDAVDALEASLDHNPDSVESLRLLGDVHVLAGRPEEALEPHRRAVAVAPDDARARHALAHSLTLAGRPEEALEHYAAALALDPDRPDARTGYAALLLDAGDADGAREQLEAALALEPDHLDARNTLGVVLMRTGQADEAVAHYEAVLAAAPDHVPARSNLARALLGRGEHSEAIFELERAVALEPGNAELHHALGVVSSSRGDFRRALGHYRDALRLAPDSIPSRMNLASALAGAGRLEEAAEAFRAVLAAEPDNAGAHLALASLLPELDDAEGALAHGREALRVAPDSPPAHNQVGALLAQAGELDRARDCFRRALELAPDYADARANLERCEAALGSGSRP